MADSAHANSNSIKSLLSSTHGVISASRQSSSPSNSLKRIDTSCTLVSTSTESTLGKVSTTPILQPESTGLPKPQSPATQPAPKSKFLSSWRDKLYLHSKPEVPGKEKWRDANLNDEERWKDWNKAKDREQAAGSSVGFYTQFYKGKGSGGYWLDIGF